MNSTAKRSVLILCTGNSCRSQMAEAIWRHLAGDNWIVASAGTRPAGYVHPWAIAALQDGGFPCGDLYSKSLDAFRDRQFDFVISVCDLAQQACPVWPANVRRLNWPFPDPAKSNRGDESLGEFLSVRDSIRRRIENFLRATDESSSLVSAEPGRPRFDDREVRSTIWLARRALAEDLHGEFDLTSAALISEAATGKAQFVARTEGVLCGLAVCQIIVTRFGEGLEFETSALDGDPIQAGTVVATIAGSARKILLLERTCLNFLGRLSGVSTHTAKFVQQCHGTRCIVLDTRKTTPGWRALEKYAVRCGGGRNHRMGLFDGILIKDNHLALCGQLPAEKRLRVDQAIEQTRQWLQLNRPGAPIPVPIEVEVDSLEQLRLALSAHPNIVLLDNMSVEELRCCVELRDQLAPGVLLEASGGVRLETIAAVAQTGVDRISVGALTHSAVNFDIGLDWLPAK